MTPLFEQRQSFPMNEQRERRPRRDGLGMTVSRPGGHSQNRRSNSHMRLLRRAVLATVIVASLSIASTPSHADARSHTTLSAHVQPGKWTLLGPSQGGTTATLVHTSNGDDLVVWEGLPAGNSSHYESVYLKPRGGLASRPTDVFGGHDWGSLDQTPTLVSQNGRPLLIISGTRSTNSTDPYRSGCIVGDLLTSSGWALQPWSLSADCISGHFGATITQNGTLSAAWPGGWANGYGIRYRLGVSSTIPATPDDQHLSSGPGNNLTVAETPEAASQDVYATWGRSFSNPVSLNGIWAANLSTSSAPRKAPGSGTNIVAHPIEPIAIASPTGRGGIYLAYPNNIWPYTKVELWRYGDSKAVTVPHSTSPTSVSISAGPSGRLWIAWWSELAGTVRVVRTNEAGTRFGPVATYAGPHGCKSDGNGTIKISGGSQQRLDVVMSCYDGLAAHGANHASATQSIVPLQLSATTLSINHKSGGSVTYRVSDVGDPVQGATVSVAGTRGTTNAQGQFTFHVAKGSRPGYFRVRASMANYISASTSLQIT